MKNRSFLYWSKLGSVSFLLVLTALSYHPRFSNNFLEYESQNPLTNYIYFALFVSIALHLRFNVFKESCDIRWLTKCLVFVFIGTLFVTLLFGDNHYYVEAKNISMAFTFLLLGYSLTICERELRFIIIVYVITVCFSSLTQIFNNFGGFVIADQYMSYGKNTLGVMLASSAISVAGLALNVHRNIFKTILWGIVFITFILTVTIRARAAFISTFGLLLFIIYKRIKESEQDKIYFLRVFLFVFVMLVVLGVTTTFVDHFFDYIFSSFTQNQGDDLSSGRVERNVIAIDNIIMNPFWGNLCDKESMPLVHNYLLRQMSDYGILGSLPLLVYYFALLKIVYNKMKGIVITDKTIGFFVIIEPFIISLVEPTFPYAPGTGSILSFFLLGYSIKYSNNIEQDYETF